MGLIDDIQRLHLVDCWYLVVYNSNQATHQLQYLALQHIGIRAFYKEVKELDCVIEEFVCGKNDCIHYHCHIGFGTLIDVQPRNSLIRTVEEASVDIFHIFNVSLLLKGVVESQQYFTAELVKL